MSEYLQTEFWNNTLLDYLIFVSVLVLSLITIIIIKKIILSCLSKKAAETESLLDDALIKFLNRYFLPLILLAALFFSSRILELPDKLASAIYVITLALVMILAAVALSGFFIYIFNSYWEKRTGIPNDTSVKWIGVIIKILVWMGALLMFLDNLDIKITALIAGLGIGGIAIAFAANAILQDLFSFVTIFFDRPFEIDDYINIGDMSGTIEHIGIKTTRIRSLSGEQLVFSNTDLTNSRIRNYKRMENRRISFSIGVRYDTPSEKLRLIPNIMKDIIDSVDNTTFNRAHLKTFGDFAISFDVVYYVLSQDYALYMDVNQEINFKIKDVFDEHDIVFAFPSQTIYIEK